MRVAALYDIHGNLPALESVLADRRVQEADRIVIGGDVVWGPFPRETLETLRGLGERALFIRGNADREVATWSSSGDGIDEIASVNAWCQEQLGRAEREWLVRLPLTVSLSVDQLGEVLFCHATPRSDEEIITRLTPEEDVVASLSGTSQSVVVCGHVHVQYDRTAGQRRVVNAGSVGMPYEGTPAAYWCLLGPDVVHVSTAYDVEAAGRRMTSTSCPHVDEIFVDAILNPPPAEEVSVHFEEQRAAKT